MAVSFVMAGFFVGLKPAQASGASLLVTPTQGTFVVGSTFNVSIVLNTGGQAVNAVNANLTFPPSLLQGVNPAVSQSFVQIWTSGPSYSNTAGTLSFQGGLPNPGITTSNGIVSTIEFRVIATGTAKVAFSSSSSVLANDGSGTNILTSSSPASFTTSLAPPGGPVISSSSDPDQNKWYPSRSVEVSWQASPGDTGYTYALDNNPNTVLDEVANTTSTQYTTTVKSDGVWYFHVQAKNAGGWGGTSTYGLKIDSTAPASFTPKITSYFSANVRQSATFATTDATSGLDYYEVKVIDNSSQGSSTNFFTEQQSPYLLPSLKAGNYQLVVRAYDLAGNYAEGTSNFVVVSSAIGSYPAGISPFFANPIINNWIIIVLTALLLFSLITWLIRRRKSRAAKRIQADLKDLNSIVSEKKSELENLSNLQHQSISDLRQHIQPKTPAVSVPVKPAPSPVEIIAPVADNPIPFPPNNQPPSVQ